MRIEDAIKQKSFKSDQHRAYINLLYTANYLSGKQAHFFKQYDLTPQQFNVLRILKGQLPGAASVNLIIERMLDKSSNASRLVDKLKLKGLVSRVQCKSDRRSVNVKITPKGLELLQEIDDSQGLEVEQMNNLTNEEVNVLNELLNKIRKEC